MMRSFPSASAGPIWEIRSFLISSVAHTGTSSPKKSGKDIPRFIFAGQNVDPVSLTDLASCIKREAGRIADRRMKVLFLVISSRHHHRAGDGRTGVEKAA